MEVWIDGVLYVPAESEDLPEGYLSPHFRAEEFTCNHCGSAGPGVPQELLDVLEEVRDWAGCPVVINSGYRCPTHNANVGGAPQSKHLEGIAADIRLTEVASNRVADHLEGEYPDRYGIGRYDSFTHIDIRPTKARW